MSKNIDNMNDLSKALMPSLKGMVDVMANRVYETLNCFLQKYYDSYNPMDDISNLIATCIPCNQFKSNIAPELFEGRINEIFIYQMSKKYGNKLSWKIISRWLRRMTL